MIAALIGGSIIGIAVSLMLAFNGRVTGISGIVAEILTIQRSDIAWRILFILGLFTGGFILRLTHPESFVSLSNNMNLYDYALAGFLVGFGTLMGNGCTSGHGVCGISRLSIRSIMATVVFIFFGMLSVILFKAIKGEI